MLLDEIKVYCETYRRSRIDPVREDLKKQLDQRVKAVKIMASKRSLTDAEQKKIIKEEAFIQSIINLDTLLVEYHSSTEKLIDQMLKDYSKGISEGHLINHWKSYAEQLFNNQINFIEIMKEKCKP